jgi:hypothetical protein
MLYIYICIYTYIQVHHSGNIGDNYKLVGSHSVKSECWTYICIYMYIYITFIKILYDSLMMVNCDWNT